MLLHFAQYLVKNFISLKEITVLTLYSGQLLNIKQLIQKKFHNLKSLHISTVDNYQGEENQDILLSLVRSNKRNSIGFLKIANRVCVALSRAKKGFF